MLTTQGAAMSDETNSGSAASDEADISGGIKTLGGRQFWGDVHFFRGWRVQHNVLTDSYRLLDGKDHRHFSGTLQDCRDALQKIATTKKLASNWPSGAGRDFLGSRPRNGLLGGR